MTNAQLCVRLFVRWESDIEDWKLIMLKLYILLAVVVWLAMQSQKNTQARLTAGVQSFHARRMDMWCVFHTYALAFVFLPLFRAKPWSWFTYLFVLALVLVMLNFESAITSFLDFAGEQGKDIAEYEVFDDHGTNIFRVLVYAVVPAMSLIFQKKLFENSTPEENVLVHMSIISLKQWMAGHTFSESEKT